MNNSVNGQERERIPRPAATVIFIRDNEEGLQTYILQRSHESSFFPGNYVFPGGMLDPDDSDVFFWQHHVDLSIGEISDRFGGGLDNKEALAYCVAGIRETFEEAGLLLVSDVKERSYDRICINRLNEGLQAGWLRDTVLSDGLTLNLASLSRWSHWITPKLMKSRFDTRFFLAIPPPGQSCVPDNREMEQGVWISPEKALTGNMSGAIPLSPPTIVTIQELLEYKDTQALKREWETRSWGDARFPRLVPSKSGPMILEPWDPQWDEDADIDTTGFEEFTLAPCEPFSRLYFYKGLWKPVGVE